MGATLAPDEADFSARQKLYRPANELTLPLLDQSLKTDEFTLDTTAAETAVDNELSWRQSDAFCRTLDQLHFFVGQQLFDIDQYQHAVLQAADSAEIIRR